METTRNSLLGQQLYQVQSSASTKGEFTSFLQGLKKVILDLMNHPYGGRYNIVNQYSEVFAKELFSTQETRDFLILLGYVEGNGQFMYNTSDENMSKLEDCLEIVENLIRQQEETVLCEINGNKGYCRLMNQESKRMSDSFGSCERSRSKERTRCSSGVKEMLLSKHMKKEMSDNMVGKKNISRSSDFAFNTNGYYHQSCPKSDTKRNKRCFIRELFHKQDHDTKGWNSSGLNVKLI